MTSKIYQVETYFRDLVIVGEDNILIVGDNKKLNIRIVNCQNVTVNANLESLAIQFCPNVVLQKCIAGFFEISFSSVKSHELESVTGIISNCSIEIGDDFRFKGLMKETMRTVEVGDGYS